MGFLSARLFNTTVLRPLASAQLGTFKTVAGLNLLSDIEGIFFTPFPLIYWFKYVGWQCKCCFRSSIYQWKCYYCVWKWKRRRILNICRHSKKNNLNTVIKPSDIAAIWMKVICQSILYHQVKRFCIIFFYLLSCILLLLSEYIMPLESKVSTLILKSWNNWPHSLSYFGGLSMIVTFTFVINNWNPLYTCNWGGLNVVNVVLIYFSLYAVPHGGVSLK